MGNIKTEYMENHRKIHFSRWRSLEADPRLSPNAEVWKVEDIIGEFQGPLALKILTREERRDRFRQEARAMEFLSQPENQHPNIIPILYHSIPPEGADHSASLVTPWLPGGNAQERAITHESYVGSVKKAVDVLLPIARAVEFLHSKACPPLYIAHRDIKPANILYDAQDQPVLCDFGCAYFDERNTHHGESVGSTGYAAPEMIDGPHEDDLRPADVYSLGAVFYAFRSGKKPPAKGSIHDGKHNLTRKFNDRHLNEMHWLLAWFMESDWRRRATIIELVENLEQLVIDHGKHAKSSSISLAQQVAAISFDGAVREKMRGSEQVSELYMRANELAIRCSDSWLADPRIKDLKRSPEEVQYKVVDTCNQVSKCKFEGLVDGAVPRARAITAERLLRDCRTAPPVDSFVECAWVTTLELRPEPSDAIEDRFPIITLRTVFFVTAENHGMGLIAIVDASFNSNKTPCDWATRPICFVQSANSSYWSTHLNNLIDKMLEDALSGIRWGLDHYSNDVPLPILCQIPSEAHVDVTEPTISILTLDASGPCTRLANVPEYATVSCSSTGRIFCSGTVLDLRHEKPFGLPGQLLQAQPSWSPDGKELLSYYTMGAGNSYAGCITRTDIETRRSRIIYYNGSFWIGGCSWSPDGTHIATVLYAPEHKPTLLLLSSNGEVRREIYRCPEHYLTLDSPVWGPSSDCIYFTLRDRWPGLWSGEKTITSPPPSSDVSGLSIVSAGGQGEPHRLVEGRIADPSVSPTGQVAYINQDDNAGSEFGLYLLDTRQLISRRIGTATNGIAWLDERRLAYIETGNANQRGLWLQEVE